MKGSVGEVWEGLEFRASVPMELGCCHLPILDVFSLEALQTLCFGDFY